MKIDDIVVDRFIPEGKLLTEGLSVTVYRKTNIGKFLKVDTEGHEINGVDKPIDLVIYQLRVGSNKKSPRVAWTHCYTHYYRIWDWIWIEDEGMFDGMLILGSKFPA